MPPVKLLPRRTVLLCIFVLATVTGLFAIFLHQPAQPSYITAPVRLGSIENAVLATGRLNAIERVNVGAQVSGQVKSLKVKVGDKVTKGQPVAEIDDLLQRNDLRTAEASLNEIKADICAKDNGIGISAQVHNEHILHAEAEYTVGSRFEQTQLNIGYRYSF